MRRQGVRAVPRLVVREAALSSRRRGNGGCAWNGAGRGLTVRASTPLSFGWNVRRAASSFASGEVSPRPPTACHHPSGTAERARRSAAVYFRFGVRNGISRALPLSPLLPQVQTLSASHASSAKGHKRTSACLRPSIGAHITGRAKRANLISWLREPHGPIARDSDGTRSTIRDVRWSLAFALGICGLVVLGPSTARAAGGAPWPRTSGPVGGRAP
jgi:hypothetical protein